MPDQPLQQFRAAQVATELNKCRQRGLDDIDVTMHNQPAVEAPELERLAGAYAEAAPLSVFGRAAQVRALIRDGLTAYAEAGNEPESRFVGGLFFDPPDTGGKRTPSERLQAARTAVGMEQDERRFGDYRRSMLMRFAEFLLVFVEQATAEATGRETSAQVAARGPRKLSPLMWVGVGVAGLVIIATVVVSLVLTSGNQPSSGHAAAPPTSRSIGLPPGQKTYPEQAGEFGSLTVTTPYNPSVTGVKVQPYQKVQVSCRVYSVPAGWSSVYPDGYWYRLAGSWHNHWCQGTLGTAQWRP